MRPYLAALALLAVAFAPHPALSSDAPAHDSGRQQPAPRPPEAPETTAKVADEAALASPTPGGRGGEGVAGPAAEGLDPALLERMASDLVLRDARNAEMEARRIAGEEAVAGLAAELAQGLTPQAEVEMHRQIARAKEDAELDLLGIQAKYARLAGYEETALQIEAMVDVRLKVRAGSTASATALGQGTPRPAARQEGGE